MIRFLVRIVFTVWIYFTLIQTVLATTILIQTPEEVFKGAQLIIEGDVQDIVFHTIPNSSLGYADVIVSVVDVLKGNPPDIITMRRYGVRDDNEYLFASY